MQGSVVGVRWRGREWAGCGLWWRRSGAMSMVEGPNGDVETWVEVGSCRRRCGLIRIPLLGSLLGVYRSGWQWLDVLVAKEKLREP